MKARSGPQPNRNVRFFCRYRGKTGRSADIAKTMQMTQQRHEPHQTAMLAGSVFQNNPFGR